MTTLAAVEWPVVVTDHAMWRAAERFRMHAMEVIEEEVRAALRAGRVSTTRAQLGLLPRADPRSLYVWTQDGRRVYALRIADNDVFVVTTVMRPGLASS